MQSALYRAFNSEKQLRRSRFRTVVSCRSKFAPDLGQYVSLALLLSPPPDFHATVPANQLPPDAKAVAGLIPLLKNLYQQADLIELWSRLQPFYQAEMERYSDPVRKSIALSDAYL